MKSLSRPYQVLLAVSLVGAVLTGCNQREADDVGTPDAAVLPAPDMSDSADVSTVAPGTDAAATGASGDIGNDTTGITPEMDNTDPGEISIAPIPDTNDTVSNTNPPMDSAGTSGVSGMSNTDPGSIRSSGAPAPGEVMDDEQPADNMNVPSGSESTP